MKQQPEIEVLTLKIPPGLFTEQTHRGLVYQTTVEQYNRIGQGRWRDGQFVRFHDGLPQKIGGWTAMQYGADVSTGDVIGVPRSLHKWSALNGQELEAFGDGYKLYVLNNTAIYDITPQRRQVGLNNAFASTAGSQTMYVVDYQHGAQTGDYVFFTGGTDFACSGGAFAWSARAPLANLGAPPVFGDGYLLCTVSENVYKSTDDGATWNMIGSPGAFFTSMIFANGHWFGFETGNNPNAVWRSTDGGSTWSSVASFGGAELYGPATDGAMNIMALNDGAGNIIVSTDGGTSFSAVSEVFGNTMRSLLWDGSRFIATANSSPTATPTIGIWNGSSWTTNAIGANVNFDINAGIGFNGSLYCVPYIDGGTPKVMTSATIAGFATASPTVVPLQSGEQTIFVFEANGIFFAFGSLGGVVTSPDGITWTFSNPDIISGDQVTGATYDSTNNVYVAGCGGLTGSGSVSAYLSSGGGVCAEFSAATYTGDNTTLIAAAQTTTGGVPLTQTITPYQMPVPRAITLTAVTGDFSAINFTILGTNQETGASQSEVITGPASGKTIRSINVYETITSITPTTDSSATISAGFAFSPGAYQLTATSYTSAVAIAASQSVVAATPLTLTASPYVMLGAGFIGLTSATDLAGTNFTIIGIGYGGGALSEVLAGPNANTITSANAYISITSITPDTSGGDASAGFYFPSGSAYTVTLAQPAGSTGTGGGPVNASYDINAGLDNPGFYYGWGSGTWGQDTWGTPRTTSTMVQPIRLWSLDNWGQNLMASYRAGPVYYWQYNLGFSTKAQNISQVIAAGSNVLDGPPTSNQRILVSPDSQQLICLGGDHDGVQDPLFIITSDNDDYTDFTPSDTNNVYDGRLSSGSYIQTGIRTRTGIVIFTDISVYLMTATGDTNIYSLTQIGENVNLIGPNAAVEISGSVYLMGLKKFHVYDSVLQEIPCDIWTFIFDNIAAGIRGYGGINLALTDKITCSFNDQWSEVWWCYPSLNATENDTTIIYNYRERHWTYNQGITRTTGMPTSRFYGVPLFIDQNGTIWEHEVGVDEVDVNARTQPIISYVQSYDFQIQDGSEVGHISRCIPDLLEYTGNLYLVTQSKRYPNDPYKTYPATLMTNTGKIDYRARGKLVNWEFISQDVGVFWRAGFPSFELQEDGER